jgi:hypothetical protein
LSNCTVIGCDTENAGFATDVAVTVIASFGGDKGAVYSPAELTVPQIEGTEQPFTLQVTAVLLSLEVTAAVNCSVPPAATTPPVDGEEEIDKVTVGVVIVTTAAAALVVSACEVAVMVCCTLAGITVGAVYSPLVLIVPIWAFPPTVWFTAQVTAVLVEPVTVAVNC